MIEFISDYPGRRCGFRGREWVVTLADELAYAELLAEAFPGVRFLESRNPVSINKPPLDIQPRASLTDCVASMVHIVFDPSWTLRWEPSKVSNWWTYDSDSLPNGTMDRMTIWYPRGAPGHQPYDMDGTSHWGAGLHKGRIYFRIVPGNENHEAFARKALRLIGKMASKRNFVHVANDTNEVLGPARFVPWIGNDARRWCLEKPDRRLAGVLSRPGFVGWGLRPSPE